MKKILTFLGVCALGLSASACTNNENNTENGDLPFSTMFDGDWNKPGLYEKDGTEHVMPEPQEETGMTINVLDYGAKANDPTFDNFNAFNSAIESAVEGDVIYVPNGTYYFEKYSRAAVDYLSHIALKSGLTLRGESRENTILVSNFDEQLNKDNSTTVIGAVNVNSVVISDLTVTSNTLDSVLPDPDDSNLQTTTYTAPKYGITAASAGSVSEAEDQARNIVIDNVMVEKFQRMGVRVAMAQEVVVKNSVFQKATCLGGGGMGYGVNIQGYGNGFDTTDTFLDAKFNVVENCEFVGPYLRHGALVQYYSHNNLIKDNKFTDLLLDAIDMHGEDEYSNEIVGNEIINTRKGAAIGLGNTGATHDATGRNNYIHNNLIDGGARAIDVLLGTPNTIIYNNEIKNTEKGITCNNANGTKIYNNNISNIEKDGLNITFAYVYTEPTAGIPKDYNVEGNAFENCGRGIYFDCKGDNFIIQNNTFNGIDSSNQIVDESDEFVMPESSDLTTPVEGEYVLPTQNFFITMESPNQTPSQQKNMKLKTSNLEPAFNRMIYALFDKTLCPTNYDKVYLSITAKAQVGTPTLNIFSNTTYVDWTETTITWNNSKLHHETLALAKNTEEDPLVEFAEFKFPFAVYDFNTYYIDVTEAYNAIGADLFTLIITNEAIDESYMEIYSRHQTANNCAQAFRLIFA